MSNHYSLRSKVPKSVKDDRERSERELVESNHVTRDQAISALEFLISVRRTTGNVEELKFQRQEKRGILKRYYEQHPMKISVESLPKGYPEAREAHQILYLTFDWTAYHLFVTEMQEENIRIEPETLIQFVIKNGQTSMTMDERKRGSRIDSLNKKPFAQMIEIIRYESIVEAIAGEIVVHGMQGHAIDLKHSHPGIPALNHDVIMKTATEISQDEDFKATVIGNVNQILQSITAHSRYPKTHDGYTCPVCGIWFETKSRYTFHYDHVHRENVPVHQCPRADLCKHRIRHDQPYQTNIVGNMNAHGAGDICNFIVKVEKNGNRLYN